MNPADAPDVITLGVSLSVVALLIFYDVWTLIVRGYNTTISWNLYRFTQRFPIVGVAIGVVVGHLFWPNRAGM